MRGAKGQFQRFTPQSAGWRCSVLVGLAVRTAGAVGTARAAAATAVVTTARAGAAEAATTLVGPRLRGRQLHRVPGRLGASGQLGDQFVARTGANRLGLHTGGLGHPDHPAALVRQDERDDGTLAARTRRTTG